MAFGIPGVVLALMGLAAWESLPRNKRKRPGTPLSATYVNEVTALFYGSKRVELDHRDSTSILREEDAQGAPPRLGVDLDEGVAILRPEESAGE